ncbi:MAG: hypothetical protein K8F91_25550 [Candidatus Obscuribacterales bacterium]|nr:hypothetical protein [Candidatus Obscuribacterales bacterium]
MLKHASFVLVCALAAGAIGLSTTNEAQAADVGFGVYVGPGGVRIGIDGNPSRTSPYRYDPYYSPYRTNPYRYDPYRTNPGYRTDPYRYDPYRYDPYRTNPGYRTDPYRYDPYRYRYQYRNPYPYGGNRNRPDCR